MRKKLLLRIIALMLIMAIVGGCGNMTPQDSSDKSTLDYKQETDNDKHIDSEEDVDEEVVKKEEIKLDSKQMNSIAMLNYLAITAEEINVSKNNRLVLEEVYTTLLNNTNPESIDETTQDHLNSLRDTIKIYRQISIKRERLQYIYNQDKASTMRSAVPNPVAILAMTKSLNWKKLAVAVVYTAVDSYSKYKTVNTEVDKQFFMSGWELDDEETEAFQKSRDRAFNYMVDIVQEYKLSGEYSLSENDIKKFAQLCTGDNVVRKIQFLESQEDTYKMLGNYWLELAECYYDTNEYSKCIACVDKYNSLGIDIFRKDYNYAWVLPKAIIAVQETKTGDEYIQYSKTYADALIKNTENEDWSSRYFAAQVYIDLYVKTNNKDYLSKAYNEVLNNVNLLVDEQIKLNKTYLNDVKEEKLEPIDDTYLSKEEKEELEKQRKKEQKELNKYNKTVKEKRKTELPTLYQPLILNCDLLFALAQEIDIDSNEKAKIEQILYTESQEVFISKAINECYSFDTEPSNYKIKFDKDELVIPVNLLVEGCSFKVTVIEGEKKKVYDDFEIKKVKREGEDIASFDTILTSKELKSYKWTKNTEVEIEVKNGENYEPLVFKYKVKEYKKNFVIPDKVAFEEK